MASVLVTGGAGFIGSALVKQLVDNGHEVTVIDNLVRGSMSNLAGYLDKIMLLTEDLRDPIKFPMLQIEKFDVVFDLAAKISGIWGLYEDQPSFMRENISILLNTLEYAKDKVKHYFWISSSCIYNFDGCPLPHKEDYAFVIPKTGYDISKRFGEEIVRLYAEKYGFKYTIIRPFNVYGLNDSEESAHVITDFWKRILEEKHNPTGKFWILGSGRQSRNFTYIKDFVNALVFLMEQGITGTFNVGTGEETCIIDLLKLMFEIAELPFDKYIIEHKQPFKEDVQKRCPDVSKILDLGWKPKFSLRQGLEEMWREMQRN